MGLPISAAVQYVIVMQEILALFQFTVLLYQGPVLGQELNEMATECF